MAVDGNVSCITAWRTQASSWSSNSKADKSSLNVFGDSG